MSTLKTANIQDTSGNNNSTPEEISQGRAKAWINFDGTAATIGSGRNNYNVSSVTDNADGNYTVNLTTATANANSAVVTGGVRDLDYTSEVTRQTRAHQTSTTTIQVYTYTSASGLAAHDIISVAVFGD